MKVVLDTMIWVSYCTLKDGFRHRMVEKARRQRVRFFVSDYILNELKETLVEDLDRTPRFAELANKAVLRRAKFLKVQAHGKQFVPGDPDDDPIVRTALQAKADFLVTADKEILKVGRVQDLEVVTIQAFADLLATSNQE